MERLPPHILRHTAATRLLANGCDLHTVQRILRHRNVATTTRYLHLLNSDVQEKMRTFSPMDRLRSGNLYAYVGNNPVRYAGPSGLCHEQPGYDQVCRLVHMPEGDDGNKEGWSFAANEGGIAHG